MMFLFKLFICNPQPISMTTKNEIWDQIKLNIQCSISKSEFKTWLSQASLLEINSKLAVIEVPNKFVAAWLSDHYSEHIRKLLHPIVGTRPTLRFSYQTHPASTKEKKKKVLFQSPRSSFSSGLDPYCTFSAFIEARSNGLARSSALEVANNPVSKYNPLYIYSKWSSGKTHLLHAIGNEAMKIAPHNKAVYLSAENIISRFDKTISEKSSSFWGTEKPPRLLLLDDFHTVASHKGSQKELFSLCTQFLESKRQLVVAASAPPGQIKNLLPQLRSRLEWGLISEIKIPDQETKMKVIHQKAKQKGIQFQEDATFFLASTTNNLKNLVHQIEKIKIHASLFGNKMDISIVQSILENELPTRIGPEHIQDITATYFSLSPSDLLSRNRQRKISYPRQIAIFLTRKYTDLSLAEIGKAFGNKHHSSIIYSINCIEEGLKLNTEVIDDINKLRGFILNGVAV
ncbi:MAG: chromosomal replication initiator protein DnaA [Deltaproteobacteria bacterium]|nr:chromosomal replication initiator protein DnaA [Deltaproteobacteria bacterium]